MMRSFAVLAVLLAIASTTEGAALVRFINTVPQRVSASIPLPTLTDTGRAADEVYAVDRVGLQYFARSLNGVDVQSPTLVWTEAANPRSALINTANASPYGYQHAMPPLRAYHNTAAPGEAQVDRIASYLSTQISTSTYVTDTSPSSVDNYEQTLLKLDGVGLYLSFAAGTYQVQAYAMLGQTSTATDAIAQTPKQLTNSLRSVSFDDGKVYTIVAVGDGKFSASTTTAGNTVQLIMFEESTAPTTFGKASVRWFHAIKNYAANPISVFKGDTSSSLQLAGNIAFGSLSNYVDLAPATAQVFPVTISTNAQTVIAPSSAQRLEVTHDLRAGLRATIICAINDETTSTVFCRMIPSRAIAYVRMINDLAAQSNLVQGAFGSQPLKDVKLTLWGSYEFPRPDQTVEQSQIMGVATVPRTPANSRGLYGVVSAVASGTCSGYGEAWIPLLIMDFAVRFTIIRDARESNPFFVASTVTGVTAYNVGRNNQFNPTGTAPGNVANTQWYWGAPIFKRANFLVKTEGGSVLTGETTAGGLPMRDDTIAWYESALLLDEYMEPGQYYSLIVTPPTPVGTYVPAVVQTGASERYFWRLDRTIDGLAAEASLTSDKSSINFIAFADQTMTGTVNLRRRGAVNTVTLTPTIQTGVAVSSVPASIAGPAFTWNTPATASTTDNGQYTIDHSVTTTVADPCGLKYPTLDITLNPGDNVDVYLFNTFGCKITNNANNLVTQLCLSQSALTTGHAVNPLLDGTAAAAPAPGFFTAAASTASSSILLMFVALLAVIAAQF